MKRIAFSSILVSLILMSACTSEIESSPKEVTHSKFENMEDAPTPLISLFEIPATDISRAITFYENILELDIEQMDVEGMKMGIFPYENQPVSGILLESEGYTPSSDGVVIYFNAGDDVQLVLNRVEKNGGEILTPKTAHADESGFFAIILDTEGNRIGLNSPN